MGRELEQELDEYRLKGFKDSTTGDSSLQDTIDLMNKEQELMKDEYESEINYLKKQVAGDVSTKDTREFVDKLKETNKKRVDELEKLVDQLLKDKSKLNKENVETS